MKKKELKNMTKNANKYLSLLGIRTELVSDLAEDISKGTDPQESESYPPLLRVCENLNLKLRQFPDMPMHMCALGVEKSLIFQTKLLVRRRDTEQNKVWHELKKSLHHSQKDINSITIGWCLCMSFLERMIRI